MERCSEEKCEGSMRSRGTYQLLTPGGRGIASIPKGLLVEVEACEMCGPIELRAKDR